MTDEQNQNENMYNKFSSLRLLLTGIAMGGADLIPGVSGGTIAFILGIYEALLNAIKSFNGIFIRTLCKFKIKEALSLIPWRFIIPLGLGIAIAIFGMASTMHYLLKHEPVYLFSFFFGLVLASIITVGITVKWKIPSVVTLICGAAAGFLIVGLVQSEMPHTPLYLFFSGMVAIMAMILPGISGSFILLILGQYDHILGAVKQFDFLTILPVALGALIGITAFSRILSWLLKHYNSLTVAALVGFMVGSLRRIWPWKDPVETALDRHGEIIPIREVNILPDFSSHEFYFAVALAVIGFIFLLYITHLAKRSEKKTGK